MRRLSSSGLGALALGLLGAAGLASCFLPSASIGEGSGGGSSSATSSARSSSSTGAPPPKATPIALTLGMPAFAPMGTAMQHHLFYGSGAWWALFPDGTTIRVRRSADFALWTDVTTIQLGDAIDGSNLGVAPVTSGAETAVHLLVRKKADLHHYRAVLSSGGDFTLDKQGGDQLAASTEVTVIDAPVAVVAGASEEVFAFSGIGSTGGPTGDCVMCAYQSKSPDTNPGAVWSTGFGNPEELLPTGLSPGTAKVAARGAVGLFDRPDVTALFKLDDLAGETILAVALPAGVGSSASTTQLTGGPSLGALGNGSWAACALEGDQSIHVVASAAKGFWHRILTPGNGTAMTPADQPRPLPGPGSIFVACGKTHVHAFYLDTEHRDISAASFDGAQWTDWSVVVAADSTLRCGLTGHDRVVDGSVGLLWSTASVCTASSNEVDVARVQGLAD